MNTCYVPGRVLNILHVLSKQPLQDKYSFIHSLIPTSISFSSLFIYLFLAVLGLCCCVWAFSSCHERGLLFVAVGRLLAAVASLVVEHGL